MSPKEPAQANIGVASTKHSPGCSVNIPDKNQLGEFEVKNPKTKVRYFFEYLANVDLEDLDA